MAIKWQSLVGLTWCLAFTVSGCVPTLPMIKNDSLPVPESFPDNGQEGASTATKSWKDFFADLGLNGLIEAGLGNNQEVRILEQEIYIASNEVFSRQGEYLPKLGFQGGYGLERVAGFTSQGASDAADKVPNPYKLGNLGLISTWEVDIWKKLRNASKAAYYSYLSSIEMRKLMVTHLVAEMANVYFELLSLDNQLKTIDSYVEVLKEIKTMSEYQQNAARATSLPIKRFEAEILKNQSRQHSLKQQIVVAQNTLNTLAGRFPQDVQRNAKDFLAIKFEKLETGVPASLLENRPDVKAAAFELEAAKFSVSSAKARFYPALSIEAGVGFTSFNASHFFDIPKSLAYGIGGNLTAPLLNRQAIKAAYFSANNKQIQAIYRYEQSLVRAYTEVVNQLNAIKNFNQVYDLKSRQLVALNESVAISKILFQNARVDYIEALLTQRDALETQVELIEVKRKQLGAYVDLYKALGGGWKSAEVS